MVSEELPLLKFPFQLSLISLFTRKPLKVRRSSRARLPKAPPLSDESLYKLWSDLQREYFPDRADILEYTVHWSPRRQKRVLASVHLRRRLVRVARELRHESCIEWLAPVLYHEMCHAALGTELSRAGKKTPWHGKEFKNLVSLHPLTTSLDSWIKNGGWHTAIRRERGITTARKIAAQKRKYVA